MGVTLRDDMQAFLQLLRTKVAAEEAGATATVDALDTAEDSEDFTATDVQPWTPPQLLERQVEYTNGDTYKGWMLGDQRHGQGTHTTSDGDLYAGNWRYDLRHGHGKFTMKDGTTYEGNWEDDKAHGMGHCSYADGSSYDGEWQCDERCGWGTFKSADGQTYEGEWKSNKVHGQGRWVFADCLSYFEGIYEAGYRKEGQLVEFDAATKRQIKSYTGSFKDNMRHGEGVGVEEGVWVYRGSWRNDQRWCTGACSYADGSVYEGDWKANKRCGQGRLRLSGGYEYEGEWKDDKQHGNGKAKYANGDRYIGQWQHGKRHGHGKWTSAPITITTTTTASTSTSGRDYTTAAAATGLIGAFGSSSSSSSSRSEERREQYVGGWVEDCREGQGIAVYADGGRYQGSWKGNKRHGEGLMVFSDGLVFRGMWEDDEWIQSAADPALTRIKGPGLSRASAGQEATFIIKARDENNNLRLNGGDTFNILLVPRKGLRLKHKTAPATEITGLSAATVASTLTSTTSSQTKPTAPGFNLSVGLDVKDRQQQQLQQQQEEQKETEQESGDLEDSLLPEVVTAVAVGDVKDHGDGSYGCSYSHNTAGMYELQITNGEGEHIADSPYPIKIIPGQPSPRHCIVSGPGRHTATAGAEASFEVSVRDAFGNSYPQQQGIELSVAQLVQQLPIEARLLGSNTLPVCEVEVTPLPGGHYCCSYTAPATAGLYVLEVTSAGKHLQGSPFSVKVVDPEQIAADDETSAAAESALVLHKLNSSSNSDQSNHSASTAAVQDKVKWWGEIARQAYAAIDGSLEGFEKNLMGAACQDSQAGLSGPEAELVKANPDIPVVEKLEDLWLLSKLQQERKAKQHQHQHQQQRQAGVSGQFGRQVAQPEKQGEQQPQYAQQQQQLPAKQPRDTTSVAGSSSDLEFLMQVHASKASALLDDSDLAARSGDQQLVSDAVRTADSDVGPAVAATSNASAVGGSSILYDLD